MPGINGLEATAKIKQLPGVAETAIFVITASVLEDNREEVLASGAVEFICKPFREADLFEKIKKNGNCSPHFSKFVQRA